MQYNSWLYLICFLIPIVVMYYILPIRIRWGVLLFGSCIFFLFASRWLILAPILSTIVVYIAGLRIEEKREAFQAIRKTLEKSERKAAKARMNQETERVEVVVILLNLAILFFSKYLNFAGSIVNGLIGLTGSTWQFPQLHLLMPLGISFYTLTAISYVADLNRGEHGAEKNPLKLFCILTFFPTITEGPIERYSQLGGQLTEGHAFDYTEFCHGLQLILWGLFQKVAIADRLDLPVSMVFDNGIGHTGWTVIVGILLYTLQIYTDFAGCINIVTGSAQLFGIHLEVNFRQPFFAESVNEFWRRWHITLGAWLRDYVFYPISLSKGFQNLSKKSRQWMNPYYASTIPALFALLGVWLANGVWHGAEWKYVAYGLYYYVILALGMLGEPLFRFLCEKIHLQRDSRGFHIFRIIRTFVFVNIGMLIFRAENLATAAGLLAAAFCPGDSGMMDALGSIRVGRYELLYILVCVGLMALIGWKKEHGVQIRDRIDQLPLLIRWGLWLGLTAVIVVMGAYGPGFGAVDFIYAQF